MGQNNNQKISFTKAMLLGVNIMIGAGIFSGTAEMTSRAGASSFLGWLLAAIIYTPIVWAVARMAEVFPAEKGILSFCQQGLGDFWGFLGGWMYFFGYSSAAAMVLFSARAYLNIQFPDVIFFSNIYIFFLIAAFVLLILNNLSVSLIASMQGYLTLVKLIPIVTAIILLPFFWKPELLNSISAPDLKMLPETLPGAIFGFLGFETCASLVPMIEGGAKQARKAIVSGFIFVTCIYIAFHFSLLNIMGAANLIALEAPSFPVFVMQKFSSLGLVLIYLIGFSSVLTYFNSSNGLVMLDSTVLASLADDGKMMLADTLQKRNLFDRPFIAILLVVIQVFCLGTFVGNKAGLIGLTCMSVMLSLFLASLSLFIKDSTATWFEKTINFFAIIILLGLVGYSFLLSGETMTQRLVVLSIFGIAATVGVLIYNKEDACCC